MNDIVITHRTKDGSDEKLRQILRKIENEFTGYNEIVVIGDCPDWLQGTINIPHNYSNDKRWTMRDNLNMLQCVCLNQNVSVNFLWIDQDDVLYTIDVSKAYRVMSNPNPSGTDKITYKHTVDVLERRGFKHESYFGNYPISFNKINLMKTFDLVDFETMYGYCIKTLYVNYNRLKQSVQDIKFLKQDYLEMSSYESN